MLIISQKFDFGNRDMENILDNLNKEQREAVETVRGPLLVLAGAGSGKTKLLTSRIAYLIQNGVRPRNILAVTFTNKAAKEMKERLGNILGENVVKYMWVGTFHGICGRILRENIENYSFQSGKRLDKNFSIYDETDSNAVIKQAIKKLNLDDKVYAPKLVKTVISNAKNKMQDAYTFATFARVCIDRQIYSAIQNSNRQKHQPLNSYVSLNQEDESSPIWELSVENPESIIIDQETTEDLRKRISDYLSPMENKVLDLYLKGKGYVEIGGILNKSPKSVDNALQRIRSKIREVIS